MMSQGANSPMEMLGGLIKRVTFPNPEDGFCMPRVNVRGHCDLWALMRHAAIFWVGDWIRALGIWLNDRIHGLQCTAQVLQRRGEMQVHEVVSKLKEVFSR